MIEHWIPRRVVAADGPGVLEQQLPNARHRNRNKTLWDMVSGDGDSRKSMLISYKHQANRV